MERTVGSFQSSFRPTSLVGCPGTGDGQRGPTHSLGPLCGSQCQLRGCPCRTGEQETHPGVVWALLPSTVPSKLLGRVGSPIVNSQLTDFTRQLTGNQGPSQAIKGRLADNFNATRFFCPRGRVFGKACGFQDRLWTVVLGESIPSACVL